MKVKIEQHVTVSPWITPEYVYFEEGIKLPIGDVDKEIVRMLCQKWLDDVCAKAGMTHEVVFDMMDGVSDGE